MVSSMVARSLIPANSARTLSLAIRAKALAFRPTVITVTGIFCPRINSATRRFKFVFKPPHNPRSVPMWTMVIWFAFRFCSKGRIFPLIRGSMARSPVSFAFWRLPPSPWRGRSWWYRGYYGCGGVRLECLPFYKVVPCLNWVMAAFKRLSVSAFISNSPLIFFSISG